MYCVRSIFIMKRKKTSQDELTDYELVFQSLSNASRRHILSCLSQNGGPMQGGEIADKLSIAWSTTTEHLQNLTKAKLVSVKRQGRYQIYEINLKRLEIVCDWVNEIKSN